MTPTVAAPPAPKTGSPELLYLLHADPNELAQTVAQMRTADVAECLSRLRPDAAARVLSALPFDLAVQVLEDPELETSRAELIQLLEATEAAALIDAMSADEKTDLFRDLGDVQRTGIMKHLDPASHDVLKLLLAYAPDSAGGLMTTEFVSIPPTWTAAQALEHIARAGAAEETAYTIYVLAPDTRALLQVVSLRDLMMADRGAVVSEIGDRRAPLTVTPSTDREEVARLISRYDMLAIPVVDEGRRVLGIVTVDDVIDALVREQTEDVHKFGGMAALDEPYPDIGFGQMIRKRVGWLVVLFLGQTLTATAMGYFESEMASAMVLALFVPLIISSGGNSGSQATSLMIRAMALREVGLKDWWRVAVRELPTGVVLGGILGLIGMIRIVLWDQIGWYDYGPHYMLIALTVGAALLGVVTIGSLTGSMLPFVLRRFGADPASASAPFVATLVDVTGIIIYFTVAAIILRGTLL